MKLTPHQIEVVTPWIERARRLEAEATLCRNTVASLLQVIAPGFAPEDLELDVRTMTIHVRESVQEE